MSLHQPRPDVQDVFLRPGFCGYPHKRQANAARGGYGMGGRATWMRSALGVAVVVGVVVGLSPGAALAAGPCSRDGAGWTLSTDQFSNVQTRHAYVGNGYL